MARGSKGIGIRGELEVAKLIEKCGFEARRGQQYEGSSDSPDVVVGEPLASRVLIEVKKVQGFASMYMKKAYIKALSECDLTQTPVIVHRYPQRKGMTMDERRLAKRWLVTVDARFFFHMMRKVL